MNWEWYAIVITLLLLDANMILSADILGHVRATLCLSVAKSMLMGFGSADMYGFGHK